MNAKRQIRTLSVIGTLVLLSLPLTRASAQVGIDDFQTGQTIAPGPDHVGPVAGVLGSHRTGRVKPLGSTASMSISAGSAAFVSDGLGGNVILEWDGDSDTATYNETGLSGVDLTMDTGGMAQVGLKFDVVSTGPYTVNVVVSTSDRLASSSLVSGVGPEQVAMLFNDFVDEGPDGGADFTNVGAILMNFAGNSSFSISGVETCPDPGLPVELASFDAVTSGSVVELRWVVASQVDNAGFEIEHKFASQASDWDVVEFVPSTGNSDTDVHYSLRTDVQVAGRHQFRLRMIDIDGTFSYSPMTEVSVDVPGSFVLGKAYPNPFNPGTSFTLSLAKGQNISVALYDLLGRRVKELHNGYLEGAQSHQFRLDAADLSTGIYMIKAEGQFETASEMVTLVK